MLELSGFGIPYREFFMTPPDLRGAEIITILFLTEPVSNGDARGAGACQNHKNQSGETAMAIGNVYVFNTTSNAMNLILNNHIVSGQLNGVTSSNGYTPTTLSIPRNPSSGNPGNATFGGQNTLIVSFPDGTAQSYTVNIDPSIIPITGDLQLYIFFNILVLLSPGVSNQTVITASAAFSATEFVGVKSAAMEA